MKQLLLDMDGVIVDFITPALEVNKSTLAHDDVIQWDIQKLLGKTIEEFWEPINAEREVFWTRMNGYPWGGDLINFLQFLDVPWTIVTDHSNSQWAAAGKVMWIKETFGDKFNDYVITKQKQLLAKPGVVLLDDSESNCDKFWNAGGEAILFPQPWNRHRHLVDNRLQWTKNRLLYHKEGTYAAA